MTDLNTIKRILSVLCLRYLPIQSEGDWKTFQKTSTNKQWVYLYHFGASQNLEIIAWGTSANSSDRIRKASMFNPKLTGKYDRRVDYLMLKEIYGMPEVFIFETKGEATVAEAAVKTHFSQSHCYRGLPGTDRKQIAQGIVADFKKTPYFQSLTASDQSEFKRFLQDVYFAFRKHPTNPKRTFYWGDCLEPGFLRTIGVPELEPVVERTLRVLF